MIAAALALLLLQPDPDSLQRIFVDALQRRIQQYGMADTRTAQAARDLGLFLKTHGNPQDARIVLSQAIQIDEAAFGPKALQTLHDAAELAAISPPEIATPLWLRAAESPESGLAPDAFDALAAIRGAAGDSAGAVRYYRKALAAEQAISGKRSPQAAVRMAALAMVLKPAEGIPMLMDVVEINRDTLGPRHPETATTATNLAGMLVNAGRPDAALPLLNGAIKVFEITIGPGHPRVATATSILAFAMKKKGDRKAAEALYRKALAIDEKVYGPNHEQTLADRKTLNDFLQEPAQPHK